MTLDLMRRDPDSPNGMTEFLVANTVSTLRDRHIRELSVNFAVMGRLFDPDAELSWRERLARAAVSAGNPFFQLESLHAFNRRFRPDWRPRLIVYEHRRSLPRVALLYSGIEGCLPLAVAGQRSRPKHDPHDVPVLAPVPA
jgi:lysyl-tRNA synthetase class 2